MRLEALVLLEPRPQLKEAHNNASTSRTSNKHL